MEDKEFYDSLNENKILKNKNLIKIEDPSKCTSGSKIPFEYLESSMGTYKNKKILDYGCGYGWLGTYFAKKGALVHGFDISEKMIKIAKKIALINNVSDITNFSRMSAYDLKYPENYFDFVIGIGILHHLNFDKIGKELSRVIKKGGKAIFLEPLGEARILNFIRDYILNIHFGKIKNKKDEHPLRYGDIGKIGNFFSDQQYKEFQLISMVSRIFGDNFSEILKLNKIDEYILKKFPSLKKYCRLVVVTYKK